MPVCATLRWTAARHWAEIASLSPMVMGERLPAMSLAGPRPSVTHQAETARMVIEKGEAVAESATTLWLAAVEDQQLAWQRAWRAGRISPAPADFALGAATARKLGRALSPVSRRVTASTKGLAAEERRKRQPVVDLCCIGHRRGLY